MYCAKSPYGTWRPRLVVDFTTAIRHYYTTKGKFKATKFKT